MLFRSGIDEEMSLLAELPAGAPDEAGNYPAQSVNGRVAAALEGLTAAAKRFAARDERG